MMNKIKKYLKQVKKDLKDSQRSILLKWNAIWKISSRERQTYSRIWKALSQSNLENIEEESANYPTEFSQDNLDLYFESASNYKVIKLGYLSNLDKDYLKSIDFSLKYLELNRKTISKKGTFPEESERDKQFQELNRRYPGLVLLPSEYQAINFQQYLVKEGCVCAICPQTGKTLSSNRSLVAGDYEGAPVFYRFVGKEVFYLLCHTMTFYKMALYFPSRELIIVLYPNSSIPIFMSTEPVKKCINNLKAYTVNSWKIIKDYLLSTERTQTIALIGHGFMAHHLGQVLTGIQQLKSDSHLDKIDKWIVFPPCFFGDINEIFPEISLEKVKIVKKGEKISLMEEVAKDNGFLVKPRSPFFIGEEFANHIYNVSLAKCSPSFLVEVEKAKEENFPLMLVTIRLGKRKWISQIEGIANIIKSLSENFPKLGVVFDGISTTSNKDLNELETRLISKEKELVSKIVSLLPQQVKVYDTIGCLMHESIVWAGAIDFYLAPAGTGLAKLLWIVNKPGVTHENSLSKGPMRILRTVPSNLSDWPSDWPHPIGLSDWPSDWPWALALGYRRENGIMPQYLPRHHITDICDENYKGSFSFKHDLGSFANYDFDWRIGYEYCLKLAKSLKKD